MADRNSLVTGGYEMYCADVEDTNDIPQEDISTEENYGIQIQNVKTLVTQPVSGGMYLCSSGVTKSADLAGLTPGIAVGHMPSISNVQQQTPTSSIISRNQPDVALQPEKENVNIVLQNLLAHKSREDLKNIIESLVEKNETVLSQNDALLFKPNPRNVRKPVSESPYVEKGRGSPSLIQQSYFSNFQPLHTSSTTKTSVALQAQGSFVADAGSAFPPVYGQASFPVSMGTVAKVTKAADRSAAQLQYKGHNIAGTILRPKSPTRTCRLLKEDHEHFSRTLFEKNVTDMAAIDVLKIQKHEMVCAVAAPALFRSRSGVFISNIDMMCYWCNFCPFKCENKESLLQHIVSHRFHCKYCNYQSFSRADVINHSTKKHPLFEEMSLALKYCCLLPDYLQVSLQKEEKSQQKRKLDDEATELPSKQGKFGESQVNNTDNSGDMKIADNHYEGFSITVTSKPQTSSTVFQSLLNSKQTNTKWESLLPSNLKQSVDTTAGGSFMSNSSNVLNNQTSTVQQLSSQVGLSIDADPIVLKMNPSSRLSLMTSTDQSDVVADVKKEVDEEQGNKLVIISESDSLHKENELVEIMEDVSCDDVEVLSDTKSDNKLQSLPIISSQEDDEGIIPEPVSQAKVVVENVENGSMVSLENKEKNIEKTESVKALKNKSEAKRKALMSLETDNKQDMKEERQLRKSKRSCVTKKSLAVDVFASDDEADLPSPFSSASDYSPPSPVSSKRVRLTRSKAKLNSKHKHSGHKKEAGLSNHQQKPAKTNAIDKSSEKNTTNSSSKGLCWTCGYCSYLTPGQGNLKVHMQCKHPGKAIKFVAKLTGNNKNKVNTRSAAQISENSKTGESENGKEPKTRNEASEIDSITKKNNAEDSGDKNGVVSNAIFTANKTTAAAANKASRDYLYETKGEKKELYQCNHCNFKFNGLQVIREHTFRSHPGGVFYGVDLTSEKKNRENVFFCCKNKCLFHSRNPENYLKHVDRCTPLPPQDKNEDSNAKPTGLQLTIRFAKKCIKKFGSSKIKSSEPKKKMEALECNYCDYGTHSMIEVKNHLRDAHGSEKMVLKDNRDENSQKLLYLCKLCAWYGRDTEKLTTHVNREHTDDVTKPVLNSEPLSKREDDDRKNEEAGNGKRRQHQESLTEEQKKLRDELCAKSSNKKLCFHCSQCKYLCLGINLLKKHLTKNHPHANLFASVSEKDILKSIYICPVSECEFYTENQTEIDRHKENTHRSFNATCTYMPAYECLYCEDNCISTSMLGMKTHILESHKGEIVVMRDCVAYKQRKPSRLYVCNFGECIYSELDRKTYLSHITAHLDGELYECTACSWVGTKQEEFEQHCSLNPAAKHLLICVRVHLNNDGTIKRTLSNIEVKHEAKTN